MMNNMVLLHGRVTHQPVTLDNKDGSKAVLFTVACNRSYKDEDGNTPTDFVEVRGFIPAAQAKKKNPLGVYEFVTKGSLIGVQGSVRSESYNKDNTTIYKQVIQVESIDLRESKAAREARANK